MLFLANPKAKFGCKTAAVLASPILTAVLFLTAKANVLLLGKSAKGRLTVSNVAMAFAVTTKTNVTALKTATTKLRVI